MHDGEHAFSVYVVVWIFFFHSFTQTDKRECVLFFLLGVLSVELYDQILGSVFVFTHSFPFFLSFYSMHQ